VKRFGIRKIEISRRLIRQYQLRVHRERSRNRRSLLLTA
jgi:hypothetical protein